MQEWYGDLNNMTKRYGMPPKVGKKKKKERTKKPKKAKKAKVTLSPDVLAAWDARLVAALEAQLAAKKSPYFKFMGKDYTIDALDGGKTLKMSAGEQNMSYPILRLKVKDKASLAQGMAKKGNVEDKTLAAFYLTANKQSSAAKKILMMLDKAQRDEVEQAFAAE